MGKKKRNVNKSKCNSIFPVLNLYSDYDIREILKRTKYKWEWYHDGEGFADSSAYNEASKICSMCGKIHEKSSTGKYWTCSSCGYKHETEMNAMKIMIANQSGDLARLAHRD